MFPKTHTMTLLILSLFEIVPSYTQCSSNHIHVSIVVSTDTHLHLAPLDECTIYVSLVSIQFSLLSKNTCPSNFISFLLFKQTLNKNPIHFLLISINFLRSFLFLTYFLSSYQTERVWKNFSQCKTVCKVVDI